MLQLNRDAHVQWGQKGHQMRRIVFSGSWLRALRGGEPALLEGRSRRGPYSGIAGSTCQGGGRTLPTLTGCCGGRPAATGSEMRPQVAAPPSKT